MFQEKKIKSPNVRQGSDPLGVASDHFLKSDLRRFVFLLLTILALFVIVYVLQNKTDFLSRFGQDLFNKLTS